MLVNYPISAVQANNWVHESIYEAITFIFENLNNGVDVAAGLPNSEVID
jgi:hypothetical protein